MKNLLISFLMFFSMSANAAFIDTILISPDPALSTSDIFAEIRGELSDPSFFISSTNLTLSGNTFTFDIFSNTSGGIITPVTVPFEVSENLGMLSPGEYNFVANGYIANNLTSTLNTSFTVSAIPLPASIWLFLTGIVALFRFKAV